MFTKDIADQRRLPKVVKELFKSNSKEGQPNLKMGKVAKQVNRHRTKEDTRMTDKHLKVFAIKCGQRSCKYTQQVSCLPNYHHQMLMEQEQGASSVGDNTNTLWKARRQFLQN